MFGGEGRLFGDIDRPPSARRRLTADCSGGDTDTDPGPPLLELIHPYSHNPDVSDEPPPLPPLSTLSSSLLPALPLPRFPTTTRMACAEADAGEGMPGRERGQRVRATAPAAQGKSAKLADRPLWVTTGANRRVPQGAVKTQVSSSQLAMLARQACDGPPSAGELLRILQVANAALVSGVR